MQKIYEAKLQTLDKKGNFLSLTDDQCLGKVIVYDVNDYFNIQNDASNKCDWAVLGENETVAEFITRRGIAGPNYLPMSISGPDTLASRINADTFKNDANQNFRGIYYEKFAMVHKDVPFKTCKLRVEFYFRVDRCSGTEFMKGFGGGRALTVMDMTNVKDSSSYKSVDEGNTFGGEILVNVFNETVCDDLRKAGMYTTSGNFRVVHYDYDLGRLATTSADRGKQNLRWFIYYDWMPMEEGAVSAKFPPIDKTIKGIADYSIHINQLPTYTDNTNTFISTKKVIVDSNGDQQITFSSDSEYLYNIFRLEMPTQTSIQDNLEDGSMKFHIGMANNHGDGYKLNIYYGQDRLKVSTKDSTTLYPNYSTFIHDSNAGTASSNGVFDNDFSLTSDGSSLNTAIEDFMGITLTKDYYIMFEFVPIDFYEDNLLNEGVINSKVFKIGVNGSLSKPIFANLNNGDIKYNNRLDVNGNLKDVFTIPRIKLNDDYMQDMDNIKAYWQIVSTNSGVSTGIWYSTSLTKTSMEAPVYKEDANGNYILDSNGNKILVTPEKSVYTFNSSVSLLASGTYTIQAKVVDVNGNTVLGDAITITLKPLTIIYPTIYCKNSNVEKDITDTYDNKYHTETIIRFKPDDRFVSQTLYINGKIVHSPYSVSDTGKYEITVEAISKDTYLRTSKSAKISLSTEYPATPEIYGAYNNQKALSYKIYVIRLSNAEMTITLTKDGTKINPTISEGLYNGRKAYTFPVTEKGTYTVTAVATHNDSGLTRQASITNFKVIVKNTDGTFLEIQSHYPQEDVDADYGVSYITPSFTDESDVTFNIKKIDATYRKYIAPLLLLDNTEVSGKEDFDGQEINNDTKTFEGIIDYTPELPSWKGVVENSTYYQALYISFINNATKPKQSEYKIFLDGHLLSNPFQNGNSFEVNTYGYHFVTIIGWNNVRPTSYVYKSFKFLLKMETPTILRRPFINVNSGDNVGSVKVRVNYPCKHSTAIHTLKITYTDGTVENFTYDYNVGYKDFTFKKNCTLLATTTLGVSKDSKDCTAIITTIYDKKPDPSTVKILGAVSKQIVDPDNSGKFINVNICPGFIVDIPKNYYNTYELYVNGMSYESGVYITNRDEELRKYTIEVILTNPYYPDKKSYYYNEIIVDTISPAFPMLLNYEQYNMNRKNFNYKNNDILLKKEENVNAKTGGETVYLNYQYSSTPTIINVDTYVVPSDNEYILSFTYTYYNGVKRTASFYFSVNTTFLNEHLDNSKSDYKLDSEYTTDFKIEDLLSDEKYFRVVLKTLDYNNPNINDIVEDGELVIDRRTGHIYYKKENIIQLQPITKSIEDIVINVEKHLYNVETSHLEFQYFYEISEILANYYLDKVTKLKNKLTEYNNKLIAVCNEIDSLRTQLDEFIVSVETYESTMKNEATLIFDGYNDTIAKYDANITELTNKFRTFVRTTLLTLYNYAGTTRETVNYQTQEIAKCVTMTQFNQWKQEENNKYNRTKSYLDSKNS